MQMSMQSMRGQGLANLEWHLGKLIQDGHVEHQAPEQVLQHGWADVPGGTSTMPG